MLRFGASCYKQPPWDLDEIWEVKVAAQGDIKKMFYAVRVTKEEKFMQIFIQLKERKILKHSQ